MRQRIFFLPSFCYCYRTILSYIRVYKGTYPFIYTVPYECSFSGKSYFYLSQTESETNAVVDKFGDRSFLKNLRVRMKAQSTKQVCYKDYVWRWRPKSLREGGEMKWNYKVGKVLQKSAFLISKDFFLLTHVAFEVNSVINLISLEIFARLLFLRFTRL